MRSRTIREGSVGLLILVGLSAFVGLVLWIRGFKWGTRTYQFTVTFVDVAGMKVGASVRYRGVDVGKITEIQATTNGVDATIQLDSPNLVIPRHVKIEANQSGLIGETSIDITPPENLPSGIQGVNPHSSQCDIKLVICHKNRVNGEIGVSFIELLRNTDKLTKIYTDPAFFDNVNALTKNASLAASGVAKLTAELSLLTRSVRQQVGTFSTATNTVTVAAAQTANRIGNTADKFGNTAEEFGKLAQSSNELLTSNQANLNNTLQQFSQLATSANRVLTNNQDNLNTLLTEFTKLAASTNELVATNRGTLQKTLTNISQSSEQLTILVTRLANTTEKVDVAKIVGNLETLSANAAEASANLRDVTAAVNNPTNFLVLQQTLDSARATFENVQKITADLDELTGDPQFRQNVKELVNGLSKLVSSTEQLQEQIQVAQQLETVNSALKEATSQSTDSIKQIQPSPTKPHPKKINNYHQSYQP